MPEYEYKFNALSRFAPELIPIEEEKCRHFEKGLWLDIQAVVTATTYPSMRALSAGFARRPRDAFGFRGPSKRGGSNSSSAGSGWFGGHGSRSSSGRSGPRPAWSQHSG